MTAIIDNFLYVGDFYDATDENWLQQHNITHILTCASEINPQYISIFDRDYCHLPLTDLDSHHILDEQLPRAINFIKNCRQKCGKILIHCIQGINRSVTIAMFYMSICEGYTLIDAYQYIKKCRACADPTLIRVVCSKKELNSYYSHLIDDKCKKYFNTF